VVIYLGLESSSTSYCGRLSFKAGANNKNRSVPDMKLALHISIFWSELEVGLGAESIFL